jgi:hypothetical protein
MDGEAIAERSVGCFPPGGIEWQQLITATERVTDELVEQGFYGDHFYSERWAEKNQYFRLGFADGRRDMHGEPMDPSHDILVLPTDGKDPLWFQAGDTKIFGVRVRSRQNVDSLLVPLRNINEHEREVAKYVWHAVRILQDKIWDVHHGRD